MAEGIKTIPVPVDVIARMKDICTALKDIAAELGDFCTICDQFNEVLTASATSSVVMRAAPKKRHKLLGSRRWTDQEKAFVSTLVEKGLPVADIYNLHKNCYAERTYKAVSYMVDVCRANGTTLPLK